MKIHIFTVLLCLFLAGCANTENQTELPAETVRMETKIEEAASVTVIQPLLDTTMEALADSTVNISFAQNGFYRDESGNTLLQMQIYSFDKFDMVDISGMKAGDILLVSGEEIVVNSVERNESGTVLVNGGLDAGGFDLATDDSGIYYLQGYSDMKSWNLVGEAECPVSNDFVFTDYTDLDIGSVTYSAEDLLNDVPEYGYQPQNTSIRIENGLVVTMERNYTP